MVTAETVISALSAAGIGGIAGHIVAGAKERREARARVFEAVAKVERARWAPASTYEELHVLRNEAAAAMLVARIPRRTARQYLVLAHAAGAISEFKYETTDEGSIPPAIAQATADAARAVVSSAWHPWWGRITALRRRQLDGETFSELRAKNSTVADALDEAMRLNRV
ncbi:hypothetical protein [Promicromonospora aerolata]|uniref:Uncharacterized protein n=1 Tax=Promicromonospora aerolata TaxID=195749 RepID=A0ABW4VBJ1_9MICO